MWDQRCCPVGALLLATSCSFATSHTPSKLPVDNPHFGCSVGAPVIDTVIGAPLTATAIGLVAADLFQAEGLALYAAFPALIGVPFAISAIYGWHDHGRCTDLMSASDREWALAYASHAEQLASSGKCDEAWVLGAKADARDHEVYIHDFLERPAIVDCRTAAREAAEAAKAEEERRRAYHEQHDRHDQAMDVAKRAREAAKRGACDEARALIHQAEELDAAAHTWIVNDLEIAKCLAPPGVDAAQ